MELFDEIHQRLTHVQDRIEAACRRSQRPVADVALLAVTKLRNLAEIQCLYQLGLRAFGENRVLEAQSKQALLPADCQWHMIGHLQSNKITPQLGFSWLQSLDGLKTAVKLNQALATTGRHWQVLIEIHNQVDDSKSGVRTWDELLQLFEALDALKQLSVAGLMIMAPYSNQEALVRPCFARLREWRDRLQLRFPETRLDVLSMGMSNDFEWAIAEGSTMLRIGTLLFPERP